ncbi:MAG: RsmB/NOP family class I SAM-dependent RNA methyltransferase, partial [Spirochaetia bacterium]|nr:RsmB/NOP family class I SAM-dependent RNA methyltransferase [Spirochaetia bacterium]
TWGLYQKDMYDRVLLDAPCSSERHVLSSPYYLAQWTPARTKQLAIRQFAMLAAALDAAKAGGRIVYSTCSISPLENDGVVEKLFKKRKGLFDIVELEPEIGEKTKYGIQILPDTAGAGPIYYCCLEKRHG